MRKVFAIPEYCMGCGLCEVYCVEAHSPSHDLVKAYLRERPKPVSRVRAEVRKPLSFAVQCRHCDNPPCVDACLTGALAQEASSGAVTHDAERCVGCLTCVMVCPAGAVMVDSERGVVAKCDLCSQYGMPVCVEKCPNQALIFVEDVK
ncbi:MAG: 4Fe-4S dicluster domain-containing protein [Candidatus Bathyarchaeia archaeon]